MRVFVLKSEDGYYSGISPMGRVMTVPTIQGSVFFSENELSSIVLDKMFAHFAFYAIEMSEPEEYKAREHVSMVLKDLGVEGAEAVAGWFDAHGWPTKDEPYIDKLNAMRKEILRNNLEKKAALKVAYDTLESLNIAPSSKDDISKWFDENGWPTTSEELIAMSSQLILYFSEKALKA